MTDGSRRRAGSRRCGRNQSPDGRPDVRPDRDGIGAHRIRGRDRARVLVERSTATIRLVGGAAN